MKVVVTGGLGLIGSTISRYLLDRKHEVIILDNIQREGVQKNINRVKEAKLVKSDIRNITSLDPIFDDADAMIHCAANPGVPLSIENPLEDFSLNAEATIKMLEIARKRDLSFIYCSTNKVYPREFVDKSLPFVSGTQRYITENTISLTDNIAGGTHSPYGCSKLAGDIYCSEYFNAYGLKTVINRMSCIYGTHQYGTEEQGWIAHFIFSAIKNKTINIFGDGKQVRDCLWAEDLARLFYLQLKDIDTFKGTKWNVGGGEFNTLSLLECISFIEEFTNKKIAVKHYQPRLGDHKVYISNIDPLAEYWKPEIGPYTGIRKLYDWAKNV